MYLLRVHIIKVNPVLSIQTITVNPMLNINCSTINPTIWAVNLIKLKPVTRMTVTNPASLCIYTYLLTTSIIHQAFIYIWKKQDCKLSPVKRVPSNFVETFQVFMTEPWTLKTLQKIKYYYFIIDGYLLFFYLIHIAFLHILWHSCIYWSPIQSQMFLHDNKYQFWEE